MISYSFLDSESSFAELSRSSLSLSSIRQVTFEGRRSGEGYFAADGKALVFQSEREADNPFYQIYRLDLETGDTTRVSPGHAKTTCAWLHPDGQRVLYASTQDDPEAVAKQEAELTDRAAGTERRYSWDYDAQYDLFAFDRESGEYTNLTDTLGYDAECAYSPDGEQIVFASNRHGYSAPLPAADAEKFAIDKSFLMDIYVMDSGGRQVRRLTDTPGYDGGPFFSADGTKICWRRFSENGATAEVWTMNADGTDQRAITDLGAMSWAPFFHPSGDYLIFTTNLHGFANFELYIVDAAGAHDPVRVTDRPGFDGLPSFSPDGATLAWTSNRTPKKQSQIFFAAWNDAAARTALGLPEAGAAPAANPAVLAMLEAATTEPEIRAEDLRIHIEHLASPKMEGRMTGTDGERMATEYVARYLEDLGLQPEGDDGTFYQSFEFTAGIALGAGNHLALQTAEESTPYPVDEAWRPLAFSKMGKIDTTGVVFAGYGLVAPATEDQEEYDSYVHLDVTDQWVMVFRGLPDDVTPSRRQHLARHGSLRYKAMLARDRGAKGILVVSGPQGGYNDELVTLAFDVSLGTTSIGAISLADAPAAALLAQADRDLGDVQTELDNGAPVMGFPIPGVTLDAEIWLDNRKGTGRNVIARLPLGNGDPHVPAVLVGAHIDHLGRGNASDSLAKDDEADTIHFGADDNASGVAAMLELAERFAGAELEGKRDIVFAAWSGEEMGLLGSDHYVKAWAEMFGTGHDISMIIAACINMDMVGRLDGKLVLNGIGSSSVWRGIIERANVPVGLSLSLQEDSYLPTDATSFYTHGVPVLSAFSGVHSDYHTPRDTPDKINYPGTEQVARLMYNVTRALVLEATAPGYLETEKPEEQGNVGTLRAYLGTVPDYAESDRPGMLLSAVTKRAPAADAGLLAGDRVVELAGRKIENVYDYTYAIQALKVGETVSIAVERDGTRVDLEITPGSRE